MGKFDKRLKGEKEGERKLPGKRQKFLPVTDTAAERAVVSRTADKLLREKTSEVLDVNKAIGRLEAEARQQRHVAKRAHDGSDDEGGGGSGGRGKGRGRGGRGGRGSRGRDGGEGKGRSRLPAKGGISKRGSKGGKSGRGGKGKR